MHDDCVIAVWLTKKLWKAIKRFQNLYVKTSINFFNFFCFFMEWLMFLSVDNTWLFQLKITNVLLYFRTYGWFSLQSLTSNAQIIKVILIIIRQMLSWEYKQEQVVETRCRFKQTSYKLANSVLMHILRESPALKWKSETWF